MMFNPGDKVKVINQNPILSSLNPGEVVEVVCHYPGVSVCTVRRLNETWEHAVDDKDIELVVGYYDMTYWNDGQNLDHLAGICTHEWKKYTGLTDVFDYCVKCDVKKV